MTGADKGDREAIFIMGNPIGVFSNYWGSKTLAQGFATGSLAARRDAFAILDTFQAGLEIGGWKRDRLYLMVAAYHRALVFRQMATVQKLGFVIAHELQQRAHRLDKILAPLLFPARARVNRFADFNPADLERLIRRDSQIEIGAQGSASIASRPKPKKVSRPVLMAASPTVATAEWVTERLEALRSAEGEAKKPIAEELHRVDITELIAQASTDDLTAIKALIKLVWNNHENAREWLKQRIIAEDVLVGTAIVETYPEAPIRLFLVNLVGEGILEALAPIGQIAEKSPDIVHYLYGVYLGTKDEIARGVIRDMVREWSAERVIAETRETLAEGDQSSIAFAVLGSWALLGNPAATEEIISFYRAGNPTAKHYLKELASESTNRRVIDAVHDIVRSGDPKTVGELAEALTDMVVYAWDAVALGALARAASWNLEAAEGLCSTVVQLDPSPLLKKRALKLLRSVDVRVSLAERARTETRAVDILHWLAELGHRDARNVLHDLNVEQLVAQLGKTEEMFGVIKALRWAAQTGGNRCAAEVLRTYDARELARLARQEAKNFAGWRGYVLALEDLANVGNIGAEKALKSLTQSPDRETKDIAIAALRNLDARMRQQ